MDRRDFVKSIGLLGVGLFLPKWIKPSWKRVLAPTHDFEISLLDGYGREVSGAGYARVLGNWDMFDLSSSNMLYNGDLVSFPPSKESWGRVIGAKITTLRKHGPLAAGQEMSARFPYDLDIRHPNETLQFLPKHFTISMG